VGEWKTIQNKEEVDTHFILDGASGNDDIMSIWISHKNPFKPRVELCVFGK
jgi:hypothetical protein